MKSKDRHSDKKERRELKREQKLTAQDQETGKRLGRRILLWSSVLVGIVAVIVGIVKLSAKPPATETPSASARVVITPKDWVKGDRASHAVLLEYSDFQCPACGSYYLILRQLYQEFGDRMQFAYRHFPLQQHPHAEPAARAAEAAGRQGKFWEMHNLIFEDQKEWTNEGHPEDTFIGYARQLGLDLSRFRADLESQEVQKAVEDDLFSGIQAGVNGTPTFFLNGVLIHNPQSYNEFRNLLQQAIESRS